MPTTKPDPAAVEAARKIVAPREVQPWHWNLDVLGHLMLTRAMQAVIDDGDKFEATVKRQGEEMQAKCAAIIDSTTHVGELREALAEVVVAFEHTDNELYCEPGCRAAESDKNICTCGRRDRFSELLIAFQGAESVLAKLPKE